MRKTLALVLSLLMVLLCVPTYALELAAPEAAAETVEATPAAALAETETLDNVAKTDPDKGVLLWYRNFENDPISDTATPGGAPDYYDADYSSPYQLTNSTATLGDVQFGYTSIGSAKVQADPLDESDNPNHVMMIRKSNTTGNYSIINWPVPDQLLSKPGELVLEYDAFLPADSDMTYLASSYYTNRGLNHSAQNFYVSEGALVKGEWKKLTKSTNIRIVTKEEAAEAGVVWTDGAYGAYTAKQNQISPIAYVYEMYVFSNDKNNEGNNDVNKLVWYMDNIKLWFKEYADVTFRLDSLPADMQSVAYANMSNTHRSFAPGAELPELGLAGTGQEFTGWAKNLEWTEIATEAEAGQYDLYPMFQPVTTASFNVTNDYIAAGSGNGSVVSVDGVEVTNWNVDLGYTDATYEETAHSVVITAGQKAGKITVTATDVNDETYEAVINIYLSKVAQPGLNFFTGTPDPLDFEDGHDYGLTGNYSCAVVDNTDEIVVNKSNEYAQGNDSAKVFQMSSGSSAQTYLQIFMNVPIEPDRPYYFTTDVYKNTDMTEVNANWWLNFKSSTSHVSPQASGFEAGKWYKYSLSTKGYLDLSQIRWQVKMNSSATSYARLYLDNLALYPGYKITYTDANDAVLSTAWLSYDATTFTPTADEGMIATIDGVEYGEGNPYTLNHEDVVVKLVVDNNYVTFVGSDGYKTEKLTDNYVVPSPADLGLSDVNFVDWLDEDGNKIKIGSTITAAAYAGKNITAYYQTMSDPAMGFAYEGAKDAPDNVNVSAANPSLKGLTASYITDDLGRNVTRFSGIPTGNDSRLCTVATNGMNPVEYYLVAVEQNNVNVGVASKANLRLFYTLGSGNYSHTNPLTGSSVTHQATIYSHDSGEEFHQEWNLATDSAFANNKMYPYVYGSTEVDDWTASNKAFWYDFANAVANNNEQTIDLIDFRVYRAGITDVNYYNGDTLLYTDSGRGVGTGYLLRKANLPTSDVEGEVFLGWADANGNLYTDGKLDLTGDTDVYAKFGKLVSVTYYDGETVLDTVEGLKSENNYTFDNTLAPEKTGYTFVGWMDFGGNILADTVVVEDDLDVFAAYVQTPVTDTEAFSIRVPSAATNGTAALRFKATISKLAKDALDEYGFLVSTAYKLDGAELNFDLASHQYAKGAAYVKGEKDLIFAEDTDTVTFTAACYGIPAGFYDVDLIARSYATYTDGTGAKVTLYGATATQNIKAQAERYAAADPDSEAGKFYTANKTMIDEIIANVAA